MVMCRTCNAEIECSNHSTGSILGHDVIGNMTDFDSVIVGSSPAVPAINKA